MEHERRLQHSWDANAAAWTEAVRGGHIPSRRHGTDAAILDAVRGVKPTTVLDVGCGEGWLVRALLADGIDAVGVDGSAGLVADARAAGGTFLHRTYADIEADPAVLGGPFEAVVCNFALLGAHVAALLEALRTVTHPGGHLIVQTLHPLAGGDAPYQPGWREETFDAFGGRFPAAMPWYFRPFGAWVRLLVDGGWQLVEVREPLHPASQRPLSLLLVARNG